MPQLDTIYTFTIYIWTWIMLCMILRKTKTLLLIKTPKNSLGIKNKTPALTLPWT